LPARKWLWIRLSRAMPSRFPASLALLSPARTRLSDHSALELGESPVI
jgi:hypothetical protein